MKGKNKRLILFLAIAAVVLVAGVCLLSQPDKTNLLKNGNFVQLDDSGLPVDWYTDAWILDGQTEFAVTQDGVTITNHEANDARFAQRVAVDPDTVYCLSGKIRANTSDGRGANLSVDGVYAFSTSVYQSNDQWQEVALYGRTGKDQKSIVIFARLGGYGGESTGQAWFKDLSLTQVKDVPKGAIVYDFFVPQPFLNNDNTAVSDEKTASSLILFASLFFVLLFLCIKDRLSSASPLMEKQNTRHWLWLVLVLVAAIGTRVYAALKVPGYDVDIGCFTHWATIMAEYGPAQFYNNAGFCDYPPGYMNILWLVGSIGRLTGGITELMIKMPSIISDALICLVLYLEGKKHMNHRSALILSIFWAFNPISFAAGACWGQTDSLMTLLLLLSVLSVFKKQWKIALPVYVAAVLVKPQALMFGPMGVAALVMHLKETKGNKQAVQDLLIGLGVSVAVFATLALPYIVQISPAVYLNAKGFDENQIMIFTDAIAADPSMTHVEGYALSGGLFASLFNGIKFLFSLYGNTMGHYGGATINACNVYFLLDLNWAPVEQQASLFTTMLVLLVCSLPALLGTLNIGKQTKEHYSFFFATGLFLTGAITLFILHQTSILTYATLGTVMIVYIAVLCIGLFLLRGEISRLPVFAAAMLMLLFTCGTMMHERYLLPVIILLLLGFIITKDKRLLYLMVLTAIAGFINVACVLDRNIRIGGSAAHLNAPLFGIKSDLYILEYLSGGLTILASMLCLYLAVSPRRQYVLPDEKPLPPFKVSLTDVIIMLAATALYAVLAFVNLGSSVSPQTAWTASNYVSQSVTTAPAGEEIQTIPETEERLVYQPETLILDLGEEKRFTALYFGGIHYYFDASFTIESGNENAFWDLRTTTVAEGNCFQWQYIGNTQYEPMTGRYVRITADDDQLMLFEIVFRDFDTGEIIPAKLVQSSNQNTTAAHICDEPYTMAGNVPSWYNSTYFDEIYHARTGYEHLHGMRTYETSHPPLGKVLMSWAIAIFGMTPFGWRFAGALAGVLMLPGMYLLGKMLCKNKCGGLFAMLMMTFDTMHFTQTRIATIDSFVVLFIIWSVYFMLYWFRMDFFKKPFWKTLIPLLLSGIFMGLSIASKWTGVYNIIALAVIFFWGFIRRFTEWMNARKEARRYQQEMEAYQARNHTSRKKKDKSAAAPVPPAVPENALLIQNKGYMLWATIGLCIIFFIVIPLTIYYLSYIPYFAYDGGVTVEKVIHAAVGNYLETGELTQFDGMLGYHSQKALGMDHPFYSPWYEWPVIAKPMYYYYNPYNTPEKAATIMLMGNPAVWWGCLIGLLAMVGTAVYRHIRYDVSKYENPGIALRYKGFHFTQPWDFRYAMLLICFLVQFMPWVLVPRGTYIYHYFTSVPFIILCTGLCLDKLHESWPKIALILGAVMLAAALALFIAFFPYASGITVSTSWLKSMQWFNNWLHF